MSKTKYQNFEEYFADFSTEMVEKLLKIRKVISEIVPEAQEVISYNMPAFKLGKKVLVYFAAYENHIGFYALPSGNEAFKSALLGYKTGKGSIQFPLKESLPMDLIRQMVLFRVSEVES